MRTQSLVCEHPISSVYNSSVITSPAAKRLRLTDSLEQPGPSVCNSSTSIEIDSHEKSQRLNQIQRFRYSV